MADHIHDLPVCGFGAHRPHAASCQGLEDEIACGEIVDPDHPDLGKALCRHRGGPTPPELVDHVHDIPVCGFGAHNPHAVSCEPFGVEVACGTIVDPEDPNVGRALCRHRVAAAASSSSSTSTAGNGSSSAGSSSGSPGSSSGGSSSGGSSSGGSSSGGSSSGGSSSGGSSAGGSSSGGSSSGGGSSSTGSSSTTGGIDWPWWKRLLDFIFRQFLAFGKYFAFLLLWLLLWLAMMFPWLWELPGFLWLLEWLWLFAYGTPFPFPPPPVLPPIPPGVPVPPPIPPIPPIPIPIPSSSSGSSSSTTPSSSSSARPPPPPPPCRVVAAGGSGFIPAPPGRMTAWFRGIRVMPRTCTWVTSLDFYSVVPAVPSTVSRLANSVRIDVDVSTLPRGTQVVIDAVWTCRCPNGAQNISYGQVIGFTR